MTTGLVTWLRCFHCNAEQSVTGPSILPTVQYPGWEVDEFAFYTPGGHHYCPEHVRTVWLAWCEDLCDCAACEGGSGVYVDAPRWMDSSDVVASLRGSGARCGAGNAFLEAEALPRENAAEIQSSVRERL